MTTIHNGKTNEHRCMCMMQPKDGGIMRCCMSRM